MNLHTHDKAHGDQGTLSTGKTIAQRTRAHLDWFRCTFEPRPGLMAALRAKLGEHVLRDRGWRSGWYDVSWAVLDGGGTVSRCTNDDLAREHLAGRSVLVDLGGRACALLGDEIWYFISWAIGQGAVVARMDVAFDDRSGYLTEDRLLTAYQDKAYVSTARTKRVIMSETGNGRKGFTVYFGSRTSKGLVRIYNKAAQEDTDGHWWRVELEAHDELAHALVLAWFDDGWLAAINEVNRRLRFIEPESTDTNKRRRGVVSWWWSMMLQGLRKIADLVFERDLPEPSINKAAAWVERQAAPWLAAIVTAKGRAWLDDMLARGWERMHEPQKSALAAV